MGRVRRYKKYKACDPFSKTRGKEPVNTIYDEPPEIYEKKVQKAVRDHQSKWDDEDKRERMLQSEALRTVRNEKHEVKNKINKQGQQIEPKRPDESMKQFKDRIRQETRKTLVEELTKMSSTAIKRKNKLKERSLRKKLKRSRGDNEIEEPSIHFSSETGHVRPSDRGDSRSSFALCDPSSLVFGEQVLRPPDLKGFTDQLRKLKNNKQQRSSVEDNTTTTTTSAKDVHKSSSSSSSSIVDVSKDRSLKDDNDDGNAVEEPHQSSSLSLKKRKNNNIMYRDDLDVDDSRDMMLTKTTSKSKRPMMIETYKGAVVNNTTTRNDIMIESKKMMMITVGGNSGSSRGSSHHTVEMNHAREKVIDAYRLIKAKRYQA